MKKKYLFISFTIILILLSVFISSFYFIFTRKLNRLNPVEYVYDSPIKTVRDSIFSNLCCYKYKNMYFEQGDVGNSVESLGITSYENLNKYFTLDSYYCNRKSKIYYNWWGNLVSNSRYIIKLDSISINKTKISIESRVEVEAGYYIAIYHGIPVMEEKTVEVAPSTIEEYEIIKTIGDILSQKNMPSIQYAQ